MREIERCVSIPLSRDSASAMVSRRRHIASGTQDQVPLETKEKHWLAQAFHRRRRRRQAYSVRIVSGFKYRHEKQVC